MNWPTRFGTLGEKVLGKEFNEAPASAADSLHSFSTDEMPPTKHPATGEMLTSKARFREITKAHGYEEVGTAYDNGFTPESRMEGESKERAAKRREELREWARSEGSERWRESQQRQAESAERQRDILERYNRGR